MNGTLLIGILLVTGLVILIAYVAGAYNMLVRLANNIDKAWSNIDVILKQRHDELPKLVQVCNSYMTHERETLESVTNARSAYSAGRNINDKAQAENQIVDALGKLFAVAEQYPDLKANQEFLTIQQRISALENTIADRREFYNDSVNLYNIAIEQIPTLWVAQQVGYTARPLLTVAPSDRKDAPLDFANRTRMAA
ncbi:MAG TPA: LemA family protein [Nitrospiraceae bacterium]|jgi:LemA protein|nr:LemA family protein [Nitrospiraceae bacterium]